MTQIHTRTAAPRLAVRWQEPVAAPWPRWGTLGGSFLLIQGGRWLANRLNRRTVEPTAAGSALGRVAGTFGRGLVAGAAGGGHHPGRGI